MPMRKADPQSVTIIANTNYDVPMNTAGYYSAITFKIPAGITAGTFSFFARGYNSEVYEQVIDAADTQITMDVTSPEVLKIPDTCIDSLRIAVSGLAGSGEVEVTQGVFV